MLPDFLCRGKVRRSAMTIHRVLSKIPLPGIEVDDRIARRLVAVPRLEPTNTEAEIAFNLFYVALTGRPIDTAAAAPRSLSTAGGTDGQGGYDPDSGARCHRAAIPSPGRSDMATLSLDRDRALLRQGITARPSFI